MPSGLTLVLNSSLWNRAGHLARSVPQLRLAASNSILRTLTSSAICWAFAFSIRNLAENLPCLSSSKIAGNEMRKGPTVMGEVLLVAMVILL